MKPKDSIEDRLGTSAAGTVPQNNKESEQLGAPVGTVKQTDQAGQNLDPDSSGDLRGVHNDWGQSDNTGWGNQGNWGNEGYFQGYESRPEDRSNPGGSTTHDEPMPDLSEKSNETTKQRDRG